MLLTTHTRQGHESEPRGGADQTVAPSNVLMVSTIWGGRDFSTITLLAGAGFSPKGSYASCLATRSAGGYVTRIMTRPAAC